MLSHTHHMGFVPCSKPTKLGAEKLTPEEQTCRFIEAAREAWASEDEANFDATLERIARPLPSRRSEDTKD